MTTLQEVPKEAEWTCGHTAGAVCAECYRILAAHAADLAMQNQRLKEERAGDQQRLFHYEGEIKRLHGRLGEKYL